MQDGRAGRAEVALSSVLHDPEGRLLPWAERHAAGLGAYAAAAVAATPQTDRRLLALLRQAGAVPLPGGPEVGTARRRALAAAAAARPGLPVLAVDFDRWLYWREHAPEELAAVAERRLRAMLALTPAERLARAEGLIRLARAARPRPTSTRRSAFAPTASAACGRSDRSCRTTT